MGTLDGAESARSTYKNLLRVIEVTPVWFSFGLVCCCLFPSNALQWRMEYPVCLVPLNGTLFSFLPSFYWKWKGQLKDRHPVCPHILLQMCQIRGKISCASWLGCWHAEKCANVFQDCEVEKGMRNLAAVFFFMLLKILISLVSCWLQIICSCLNPSDLELSSSS